MRSLFKKVYTVFYKKYIETQIGRNFTFSGRNGKLLEQMAEADSVSPFEAPEVLINSAIRLNGDK